MELTSSSPAPRSIASRAHASASSSVSVRPPWVVTTKPDGIRSRSGPDARLTSSESTSTWAPKRSAISSIRAGRPIAAEFTPILSAPTESSRATSSVGADSAADGQRDEDLFGGAAHDVVGRRAIVDGRRHIEEGQLVGALLVVDPGEFDRVAHVAQVLEVHALDDASGGDVQARDDAADDGHQSLASWIAVTRIARAPIA